MTPEERIRELAKKSSIGASDAARLLAAVKTEPLPQPRRFDPFTRLSPNVGALAGLGASAVAAAISRLGIRFDGLLDVHTTHDAVTWKQALVDQGAAFLVPALVFSGLGLALARRGRPVDMLGTVGVARLPQVLCATPIALLAAHVSNGGHLTMLGWLLVSLVLLGTAAQVYLLVLGFRTATGLAGARLATGVVGALILAEIASKVFLSLF